MNPHRHRLRGQGERGSRTSRDGGRRYASFLFLSSERGVVRRNGLPTPVCGRGSSMVRSCGDVHVYCNILYRSHGGTWVIDMLRAPIHVVTCTAVTVSGKRWLSRCLREVPYTRDIRVRRGPEALAHKNRSTAHERAEGTHVQRWGAAVMSLHVRCAVDRNLERLGPRGDAAAPRLQLSSPASQFRP